MPEPKVLLVGWDGADWKIARPLMEAGQMPQLSLAVNNGASGPAASLPPYLSPMLWNSMATGKRPHRHGILGFSQVNPENGKVHPVSSRMRNCPAFWNILSARQIPNHVVGWFASHPAEAINGVCVSEAFTRPPAKAGAEWPIPPNSVNPMEWADRLGETRVRSEDIDQRLLGLFLPLLAEMPVEKDRLWEKILYRLAELYTAHNAAVTLLDSDSSWRCLAVYYHFIDWICHDFMEYRPPQRENIADQEIRFYGTVVDAAYRVQDFLLADLLQHAGPEVTLMLASDHGFHSDHLRPTQTPQVSAGIASWHRSHGMMVIAGPGVKKGEIIEGASILDVTPTLLHLLDLPVGEDMDGRALFEITEEETPPEMIPTWDDALGDWRNAAQGDVREDEGALLKQFIDLGYIDLPSNPHEDIVEMTERETAFNLGISLLDANLPAEALPHLWAAHALQPELPHYAFHLARALAALGLAEAAQEALEVIRDFGEQHPEGQALRGVIAYRLGDLESTSRFLEELSSSPDRAIALESHKGFLALKRNQIAEAESTFRLMLERDADNPSAWSGLGRALLRRNDLSGAIQAARRALRLNRELPLAYLTVAQAAEALGDIETAAQAYADTLRFEPNLMNSMNGLLSLYPEASPEMQQKVLAQLAKVRSDKRSAPGRAVNAVAIFDQVKEAHRAKIASKRAKESLLDVYHFPTAPKPGSSGKCFSIVSGLPRSGTSMVMQMLVAGGWEAMSDGVRLADQDNPRGYFEWEAIKSLAQNPKVIEEVGDKVVKVISAQLEHLPREHSYQVVFLRRPVEEIARSQQVMLDHLGKAGGGRSLGEIAAALARHEKAVLARLASRSELKVLELDYHETVKDPQAAAQELTTFLGANDSLTIDNMASAVFPDLHRQRLSP